MKSLHYAKLVIQQIAGKIPEPVMTGAAAEPFSEEIAAVPGDQK